MDLLLYIVNININILYYIANWLKNTLNIIFSIVIKIYNFTIDVKLVLEDAAIFITNIVQLYFFTDVYNYIFFLLI